MSQNIQSIHDRFFQVSLGDKAIATDFFKAHLPAHLQAQIDFSTLTLEPGRFVDKQYRAHYSDVLYSVKLVDQPAYLYVLAEHKSYPDRLLPLQLLRYLCEIWQRHVKERERAKQTVMPLPLIYPLCFYHGRQSPYPFSTDIRDCFANRSLAEELLDNSFPLIDITQYTDEQLFEHGLATSFQMLQKHIFANDLWEVIQRLVKQRRLSEIIAHGSGDYVEQLLHYIVEAGDIDVIDEFFETLQKQLPEAKEAIMTIAQRLEQRGEQRGREQGMQQGRAAREYEIARMMLNGGESLEKIIEYTHLPLDEIEKLKTPR